MLSTSPTGRRLVKPGQHFLVFSLQPYLPAKCRLQALSLSTIASSPDNFFRYTSGRWLHDQDHNDALRYQPFNIDALKKEIIKSTGASSVTDMFKLGEGRFNKAFQLQLSDGRSVVARIPAPMNGPQHFVTASEVATMKFLRERLGLTQVPRIISWSSRAEETPVGAEYIVMDLAEVWQLLTMHQKVDLVQQWMEFERNVIHAFSKGGFGSLYLRKDLPADAVRDIFLTGPDQPEVEYVLGSSVFQGGYWEETYGDPKDLNLDRGPWSDVASYLKSMTNYERAWISKYAQRPMRTRTYVAPWEVPSHMKIPEEHLHIRLLRPTMTLIDSNLNNIFLSRDAFLRDGIVEISTVTDWQDTTILPLYLTAITPNFIMNSTPNPGQDEAEFSEQRTFLRKAYHAMYFDTRIDIVWAAALSSPTPKMMPIAAQGCWHFGDLKMNLMDVALEWDNYAPGTKCPITSEGFTEQDLERATENSYTWHSAQLALEDIERRVGVSDTDTVRCNEYESAVQTNRELFQAWKETLDTRGLDNVNPVNIWPVGQDTLRHGK